MSWNLVVIDVQEAFRSYDTFDAVADGCRKLVEGARILGVETVASEQYPKGLGHTVPEVGLGDAPVIEKTVFSAWRAEGFPVEGSPRTVVCGIEAHVCVAQTVSDLLGEGRRDVYVPVDAVGSRKPIDLEYGLRRLEREGAILTTVEAVLFEWLGRAGTPEFKQVQGLIK